MTETKELRDILAGILSKEGVTAQIEDIECKGLHDEPGFHWSNPGLQQVRVTAGGEHFAFVTKRLLSHARREVLVYRFLSQQDGFPVPRLFHSDYDEATDDYLMIMEACVPRPIASEQEFQQQMVLLLARIHAAYWDKTDSLPDLFRCDQEQEATWGGICRWMERLGTLTPSHRAILQDRVGLDCDALTSALSSIRRERLPQTSGHPRCLLHGAFHPPEIMWRQTAYDYVPIGIDWERCRVGIPAEDFEAIAGDLLCAESPDLMDTLIDTYLFELKERGVTLDRDELLTSIKQEVFRYQMKNVPWLLDRYLEKVDDDAFAAWCLWVEQTLPATLRYINAQIEHGRIYTPAEGQT